MDHEEEVEEGIILQMDNEAGLRDGKGKNERNKDKKTENLLGWGHMQASTVMALT